MSRWLLLICGIIIGSWNRRNGLDAATDVVRLPAADRRKRGLVVSITADDFAVGDPPFLI